MGGIPLEWSMLGEQVLKREDPLLVMHAQVKRHVLSLMILSSAQLQPFI